MPGYEQSNNANIQVTTRELFLRAIKSQVFMKMPLLARLLLARKINWEGGKYITQPVDTAEMDGLAQAYKPGEKLTSGRKTMLDNPYFHWKYAQVPVSYDVEEELQNAGGSDTAPIKFVQFLTQKAHRAARLKLYKMMYGIGTTTTVDSDHDSDFQSVIEALTVGNTTLSAYGHVARKHDTAPQLDYWQPALVNDDIACQAATWTPSISTFRKMKSATQLYVEQPGDMLLVCGPAIFMELQSQVETKHIYNRDGSMLAKFGFNTLMLDGVEVCEDPFLRESMLTGGSTKMFLYNIPDWELRLHPARSFEFTGFTWQGDKSDGYDEWLGRILVAGNLVCWKPNGSAYLPTVAA